MLEGEKTDGTRIVLMDRSYEPIDLPHETVYLDVPVHLRLIRLIITQFPWDGVPCVSGLRVFGKADIAMLNAAIWSGKRTSPLDMEIRIQPSNAIGYQILWGDTPEHLYHSFLTYQTTRCIGALVEGQPVYIRVDSFNEAGITHGEVRIVKCITQ